jgi:hypothetical protein
VHQDTDIFKLGEFDFRSNESLTARRVGKAADEAGTDFNTHCDELRHCPSQ